MKIDVAKVAAKGLKKAFREVTESAHATSTMVFHLLSVNWDLFLRSMSCCAKRGKKQGIGIET